MKLFKSIVLVALMAVVLTGCCSTKYKKGTCCSGNNTCCKKEAICGKCGLAKGSPGCCADKYIK